MEQHIRIVVHVPDNAGHGQAVKFTIEIYTTAADGTEAVLLRTTIVALSPLAARKEASRLLKARKKARGARVLNTQGEVVYSVES
jgi:hypothetical protein